MQKLRLTLFFWTDMGGQRHDERSIARLWQKLSTNILYAQDTSLALACSPQIPSLTAPASLVSAPYMVHITRHET